MECKHTNTEIAHVSVNLERNKINVTFLCNDCNELLYNVVTKEKLNEVNKD